jgi:hypothetical protein
MIKNSERKKQRRKEEQQRKLEAARWLAGLVGADAVAEDGTERILEGDEVVVAILRQWEADAAK